MLIAARLALAAVFAVAGVAKLADRAGSRTSLRDFGVPAWLVPSIAVLLPLAELACALALTTERWARAGAFGSLVLLGAFIAAIVVSLARGRAPECHCFGQLHSSPAGWTTVARNLVLAALAGFVLSPSSATPLASVVSGFSRTLAPVVVLTLVILVETIVGLLVLYQLLRQNGRMLRRLDALDAKIGMKPEVPQEAGLPLHSAAPAFTLSSLHGGAVTLQTLRVPGRPVLLVFTEPGCSACEAILPDVGRWQREHAERLTIVPISRGAREVNLEKSRSHGIDGLLLQADREVTTAYLSPGTPSAVLVEDGLVASPLVMGPEAIRRLVKDVTAPPPLRQGDRVPSLALRDLNGGSLDLSTLRGRRILLLFWNPSCGFCRGMLGDLEGVGRHAGGGRSGAGGDFRRIAQGQSRARVPVAGAARSQVRRGARVRRGRDAVGARHRRRRAGGIGATHGSAGGARPGRGMAGSGGPVGVSTDVPMDSAGAMSAAATDSARPAVVEEPFELVIEAGRTARNYWRDIWRYRELMYFLAWRDIVVRYKQTAIGVAWAVIRPALTMLVFVGFRRLARMPPGQVPEPILVFAAVLPWQFFASALGESSGSLIGNANLISKVYFPRLIVPCAAVATAFVDFLITFGLLAMLMLWYGVAPGWQVVVLPAFVALAATLALGLGVLLAALNVEYRDFRHLVPFIVQFGLFVSPIAFTTANVPARWRTLYALNPMVGVIDGFRWALLGEKSQLDPWAVGISVAVTAVCVFVGVRYFRRMERRFADVI